MNGGCWCCLHIPYLQMVTCLCMLWFFTIAYNPLNGDIFPSHILTILIVVNTMRLDLRDLQSQAFVFFVFPTTCHLEEDSAKRKRTDHSCRQREQSCPPDLGWQLETANDRHHGRGVQLELSLVGKTPIPRPVQSGKRVSRFATPSDEVTIRYAIGWTP